MSPVLALYAALAAGFVLWRVKAEREHRRRTKALREYVRWMREDYPKVMDAVIRETGK